MSVGFRLPPGCRSRAYNLETPGALMDLSAHPWDLPRQKWSSREFAVLHNRRYGRPKASFLNPEGIGFADFQGLHSTFFKGQLRQLAEKDPGWFERMGFGKATGNLEPSEEEYHDVQAATLGSLKSGIAEMVNAAVAALGGAPLPEPQEPPTPEPPKPEPPKPPAPDDCPSKLVKALEDKAAALLEASRAQEEARTLSWDLATASRRLAEAQRERDRLGGEVDAANLENARLRSLVPVVVPAYVVETLTMLGNLPTVGMIAPKTRARIERLRSWVAELGGRKA